MRQSLQADAWRQGAHLRERQHHPEVKRKVRQLEEHARALGAPAALPVVEPVGHEAEGGGEDGLGENRVLAGEEAPEKGVDCQGARGAGGAENKVGEDECLVPACGARKG